MCIHWLLLLRPLTGMEPTTLVRWQDALTCQGGLPQYLNSLKVGDWITEAPGGENYITQRGMRPILGVSGWDFRCPPQKLHVCLSGWLTTSEAPKQQVVMGKRQMVVSAMLRRVRGLLSRYCWGSGLPASHTRLYSQSSMAVAAPRRQVQVSTSSGLPRLPHPTLQPRPHLRTGRQSWVTLV